MSVSRLFQGSLKHIGSLSKNICLLVVVKILSSQNCLLDEKMAVEKALPNGNLAFKIRDGVKKIIYFYKIFREVGTPPSPFQMSSSIEGHLVLKMVLHPFRIAKLSLNLNRNFNFG